MPDQLHYHTLQQMARALHERRLSAVELAQAHLERIDALEPTLHAYVTVTA